MYTITDVSTHTTDTHTFILHLGVDFRFFHSSTYMYIYVYRPRTYLNIPVHVHVRTYAKHSACYNVQVYNVRTCTCGSQNKNHFACTLSQFSRKCLVLFMLICHVFVCLSHDFVISEWLGCLCTHLYNIMLP